MIIIGSRTRLERLEMQSIVQAYLILEAQDYDTYIVRKNRSHNDTVNPPGRVLNQFQAFKLAASVVEQVSRADALMEEE